MKTQQRIAFIRPKAWSLANRIVDGVIKEQFPDHALDVFDVSQLIRARSDFILLNSIATFALYGSDIAKRVNDFVLPFGAPPYIFRQIKKLVQELIPKEDYCSSFQMQSLFDASINCAIRVLDKGSMHQELFHRYKGLKHVLTRPLSPLVTSHFRRLLRKYWEMAS